MLCGDGTTYFAKSFRERDMSPQFFDPLRQLQQQQQTLRISRVRRASPLAAPSGSQRAPRATRVCGSCGKMARAMRAAGLDANRVGDKGHRLENVFYNWLLAHRIQLLLWFDEEQVSLKPLVCVLFPFARASLPFSRCLLIH